MNIRNKNISRYTAIISGIISSLLFIVIFYIFSILNPKMVRFEELSRSEMDLMNFVGAGLLLFFIFCLFTLYRTILYIKNSEKIYFFPLLLVVIGILSLLFIFGDIALLSDIGKQYKNDLSQPEWYLLYPIMSFQFLTALVFTYAHIFKIKNCKHKKYMARDSNIFLIIQYVGVICGFLGLSSTSLGFIFPNALSLKIHITPSLIILLFPYVMAVIFWFTMKIKEKSKRLFDEKQILDIGKSSFASLIISMFFMLVLFITNYNNLTGIISLLWSPLVTFCTLFSFSLGTLFFTRRD